MAATDGSTMQCQRDTMRCSVKKHRQFPADVHYRSLRALHSTAFRTPAFAGSPFYCNRCEWNVQYCPVSARISPTPRVPLTRGRNDVTL